jgi:hypothetical protein
MIDAAVVGAILAVPPAIQAVRDLLKHKDPTLARQIEVSLTNAEEQLLQFTKIGDIFYEAKSYHEKLTQIDLAMSPLLEASSAPTRRGGFDPDEFDRDIIFDAWRRIRDIKEFLPSLFQFLQTATGIAAEALKIDTVGNPIGGPQEFQLFVVYKNEVDSLIRKYDPRSSEVKEEICDRIDQFIHHLRHQILQADSIIIENAMTLASTLDKLRGAIKK